MRVLAAAVGVGLLLTPSWTFAQAAPAAPRPAAPRPAAPAAPRPAPAAPVAQAPAPPVMPFQEGLKYAYLRIDRIAAESVEGRAANDRVKALNDQKVRELNERNKALQSAQQKLDQGGTVLNDNARAQLQTEIERQTRDIQRFTEDAQQDVQALQQQLQEEFQRRIAPIIEAVGKERGLYYIFNGPDSGLVWADAALDITTDVVKKFDAAMKTAPPPAAPKPQDR